MIYHPRTPQEAVNLRKEHADTAVYLAGGTDDLRLGGAAEGKDLIDITGFDFNTITEKDGKVYIGALCTLQDVIESELVPAFIREAAGFCASFAKRNSATVGGNLGLRRSDSYLAAALTAADAVLKSITPHGEQDKPVGEYLQSRGKKDFNLIGYDLLERNVTCLKEGSISFLIAQQPELQGANGIKALCDHLIFKKEVTCINYMPIDLLTVETIDYYHSK